MFYAIKVEIADPAARMFSFTRQKTMYGGKHIVAGDTIFVFASESQFYRQATNKIVGISEQAAAFLEGHF